MKTKISTYFYLLIISILLTIGSIFFIKGYYQSMVTGAAFGMGVPSLIKIIQYFYYSLPNKQEQLHQKIIRETIEQTDERLLMLRQKSASYTIQIMIAILLGCSFVTALLQFHYSYTLILFLSLIFLIIIWVISYKVLDKKY